MATSKLGVHELAKVCQVFDDIILHHAVHFMLGLVVVRGGAVCQDQVLEVRVGLVTLGHALKVHLASFHL